MNRNKPNTIDRFERSLRQIRQSLRSIESEINAIELQLADGLISPPTDTTELKKLSYSAEAFASGRSQDQILNTFMTEVGEFVTRGILLLASDNRLHARMSFGSFGGANLNIDISSGESPVAESVLEKCIVHIRDPQIGLLPWLSKPESLPKEMVCIPFVFQDAVPLVFYGDSQSAIPVESIEILIKLVGLVLQNHYLSYQAARNSEFGRHRWPVLETYGRSEPGPEVPETAGDPGMELPPDLAKEFKVVESTPGEPESLETVPAAPTIAETRQYGEVSEPVETAPGEEAAVGETVDQFEEQAGEQAEESVAEGIEEQIKTGDFIDPETLKDDSFEEEMHFPGPETGPVETPEEIVSESLVSDTEAAAEIRSDLEEKSAFEEEQASEEGPVFEEEAAVEDQDVPEAEVEVETEPVLETESEQVAEQEAEFREEELPDEPESFPEGEGVSPDMETEVVAAERDNGEEGVKEEGSGEIREPAESAEYAAAMPFDSRIEESAADRHPETEEAQAETAPEEGKSESVQEETEDADERIRVVSYRPPASPAGAEQELEAEAVAEEEPRMSPEEEQLHAEAHRFARLLVAEIKLYNEDEVLEGRESGRLYSILKTDIDRSREMYEKRAHPIVRADTDYFHSELVRVLARNQPELMGPDYPGPVFNGEDDHDF